MLVIDIGDTKLNEVYNDTTKVSYILQWHYYSTCATCFLAWWVLNVYCIATPAERSLSVSTISEWQLIKWSRTDRQTDGMGKASGRYWRCSVSGSTAPSPCWLETLLALQLKVQFLSFCSTALTVVRSLKSRKIFSFKDFLSKINLNIDY